MPYLPHYQAIMAPGIGMGMGMGLGLDLISDRYEVTKKEERICFSNFHLKHSFTV